MCEAKGARVWARATVAMALSVVCGMLWGESGAIFESAPPDTGSARVRFTLAERSLRPSIAFKFMSGETLTLTPQVGDDSIDTVFVKYRDRAKWEAANGPVPKKKFPNEFVEIPQFGVRWYCRPNPSYYDIPVPSQTLLKWERAYADALRSEMTLEARQERESGDALIYLNGQFVGRRERAGAVRSVTIRDTVPTAAVAVSADDLTLEDNGPKFAVEWFASRPADRFLTLPSRGPWHVGDRLAGGAKLSVPTGLQRFGDVPVEVFPVGESVDPSLHRVTRHQGDLFMNPYYDRDAFNVCPEFSLWAVPNGFYTHAWVLCADMPRPGAEAYVGTQIGRISNCGGQEIASGRCDLDAGAARTVGVLEWTENGRKRTSPLKLVKVTLEIGDVLDYINASPPRPGKDGKIDYARLRQFDGLTDFLNFEFNGSGEWKKPSSVQIFGVTLEKCPVGVGLAQSEQGNIFYGDEKPETALALTAFRDGVKGYVDCEIYDDAFRPVSSNRVPFEIVRTGERKTLKFDLAQKRLGWYGIEFTLHDAAGERLLTHVGSFALLGPDTREAGYDSPFAAWPHNGRHGSNPNRDEVAKMMWKMGLRKSWEPPFDSEAEMERWKITKSILFVGQPGEPRSPEDLQKDFDTLVAEGRQTFAAYPHMPRVIQLLHECGGRELAQEMLYRPAVRGDYGGVEGEWRVYYCTEFCNRMRREFPDFEIQVGNGSSASEMIASLCRSGFDLNLVQQLGIESKGFGTMPEECANLEAPGMLWALRETGRRFGFTNFTMNACNEYVFRPERTVRRNATYDQRMQVTDFYVRDYLISLAHGVRCISTGHLEDSKTNYYDTNWGAGCMCKRYPYSYPKRCLVAISTLTKVLDCIERYPRRVPTGELATYALEWARNRRVKDFATALWTPKYGAVLKVRYPKGTSVRHVGSFGHEEPLATDGEGAVTVEIGPTATYLIASARALDAAVVRHLPDSVPDGFQLLSPVNLDTVEVVPLKEKPEQFPMVGAFDNRDVADAQHGKCLSAMLRKREKPLPEVVWEYENVKFRQPVAVTPASVREIGLWVKGNGSFAGIGIVFRDPANPKSKFSVALDYRNQITFHGWHLMRGTLQGRGIPEKVVLDHIQVGSAALALDPVEMRPVTEPVVVGPLMVRAKDGASARAEISAEEIVAEETMRKRVGDRDLAGDQNSHRQRRGANAAESASVAEPKTPAYAFAEDMGRFLVEESGRPGFAEELKNRIVLAWRRDLDKVFAKPRQGQPFASADERLVALSSLVGIGIPEISPKGYVAHADRYAEIRKFAREVQQGQPSFEFRPIRLPKEVFGCIRRGERGQHTFVFINFSDRPQDCIVGLPGSHDFNMSNIRELCDLVSGEMLKTVIGQVQFQIPPHGCKVFRTNSGLPTKKSAVADEDDGPTIDLDE